MYVYELRCLIKTAIPDDILSDLSATTIYVLHNLLLKNRENCFFIVIFVKLRRPSKISLSGGSTNHISQVAMPLIAYFIVPPCIVSDNMHACDGI